jgi:hypothetical protein
MSNKKRKSRTPRTKRNSNNSNVKATWAQFVKSKESREVLQKAWKTPNPQKFYSASIRRLHKKYSNSKKKR